MTRRVGIAFVFLFAWLLAPLSARASDAAGTPLPPALGQQVHTLVEAAARAQAERRAVPVRRIEVQIGRLDARLRLAPCERIEPQLPSGTSAWGRTRVALHCLEGATRWRVFVPVTVAAIGPGLVYRAALPAGATLQDADLATADIDLSAAGDGPALPAQALVGRTTARAVAAQAPVRRADLQQRRWFDAGDTVRVVARGAGFAVQGSAQALGPGLEGQVTRVRTENGRILSATPIGERAVEVLL
jgi:flagella basal body P-ring formation protein FlgA